VDSAVDTIIQERRLLTHPFYVRWQEGGLSGDGLRDYAVQYYAVETSLVGLTRGDEWAGEEEHPRLWLRFAEALGLDAADVLGAERRPATRALVDTNERLSATEAGRVGALYAYESQAAEIASTKASSLIEHYGVSSGLDFFDVHSALEDTHAAAGRRAMAELEDGAVADAVRRAVTAHWAFLDQALEVDVTH
jgi:pyrroloquinoline-quinone synthase